MKVTLIEKVCLNMLGAIGGMALGTVISMLLGLLPNHEPWPMLITIPLGLAFGNWAWITVDRP